MSKSASTVLMTEGGRVRRDETQRVYRLEAGHIWMANKNTEAMVGKGRVHHHTRRLLPILIKSG
jgi:hypothetical protein